MKKKILRVISLLLAGTTILLTACQHGENEPINGSTGDGSIVDTTDSGSEGDEPDEFYFPEYEPDPAPTEKITVSPKRISSGKNSSFRIALDEEGKLWGWGANKYGQVGNGEQTTSSYDATAYTPQEAKTGTRFVSVSAGYQHALGIDKEGNLWGWGKFEDPEWGRNNNFQGINTPTQLMVGKKYVYAEAGTSCSFAIDTDGKLWAWGSNSGQLGDGTTSSASEAIHVVQDKTFLSVSSYSSVTYAIDTDGKLWGWGNSYEYGIGDGTTGRKLTPTAIMPERKFAQVSQGTLKTYALDEEGNLWGWGANAKGQLGDGTQETQLTPVPIMEGKYFTYVETDMLRSYAIDVQGDLWVWGSESNILNIKYYPQKVESSVKFLQVVEGLALDENEEFWTWGNNNNGQVGDGVMQNILSPMQVFEDKCFSKVLSRGDSTVAIDTDGKLWAWGAHGVQFAENSLKQLIPQKRFKEVSKGGLHYLAIDTDGKLWTWGENEDGQLGDGTRLDRNEPIIIMPDTKFFKVSAGSNFSFAIDGQRNLWSWGGGGDGDYGGAHGAGRQARHLTPTMVSKGKKFSHVQVWADRGGYAIDTDGTLWGWGAVEATLDLTGREPVNGGWGAIDETIIGVYYAPARVAGGGEFSSLALNLAGEGAARYAIDKDKNLCIWNGNDDDGTKVCIPTKIWKNKKISSVVSAGEYLLALDTEGKLYTTGNNAYGQLGLGTKGETILSHTWNAVMSDKSFTYIFAEDSASFAIDTDGKLWAWGDNTFGKLNGISCNQTSIKKLILK